MLQFLIAFIDQIAHDKVLIRASGLAYTTLLAIVPLVAVLFALFTAFASFDELRDRAQAFLLSQLLPTRQDEIATYLNQFTENTHRLGYIGFILLIITAILLLDNVETNFNAIWHVSVRRKLIAKLTAYTSVLVFGSVLLGASLSISARLKTLVFIGNIPELGPLKHAGSWLFTLSLSFTAFLIMYLVIPFIKVHFRSAALGALMGSILWESGKNLFANSVGQSVRYSTIYGSLAVIPIFLIWLYFTWIVVLIGLEFTFTHQHFAALVRRSRYSITSDRERLVLAFKIFVHIARCFHNGLPPPSAQEIAERFNVPQEAVDEHVLPRLQAAGLVHRLETGNGGLLPATSLERVSAVNLLEAMMGSRTAAKPEEDGLSQVVEDLVQRMHEGAAQAAGDTSARDLVDAMAELDTESGDRAEAVLS